MPPSCRTWSGVSWSKRRRRTSATCRGAISTSTRYPASDSVATCPRRSASERWRETHPRSSRRVTAWERRLADMLVTPARRLIRIDRSGASESIARIT